MDTCLNCDVLEVGRERGGSGARVGLILRDSISVHDSTTVGHTLTHRVRGRACYCCSHPLGMTDDLLQQLRGNVPNTMLADLKDSLRSGRSLDIKDGSGATAVSLHISLMQLHVCPVYTYLPACWIYELYTY